MSAPTNPSTTGIMPNPARTFQYAIGAIVSAYLMVVASYMATYQHLEYKIQGAASGGFGGEGVTTVRDPHSTFLHLSGTHEAIIAYIMLGGLATALFSGVVQRSGSKIVLPGLTLAAALLALGDLNIERPLLESTLTTVVALTIIAVAAHEIGKFWHVIAVRRQTHGLATETRADTITTAPRQ